MPVASLSAKKLVLSLFLFRTINALLVQTFFQPDEYWQSLEIAHRIVFGYGYETWEWRSSSPVRSPLHALLFVPPYWILRVLRLDDTYLLVKKKRGFRQRSESIRELTSFLVI
jgi:phosphatidylinositol glycan class B